MQQVLSTYVPTDLVDRLRARAVAGDRTLSAEVRRLLHLGLQAEEAGSE